MKRFRPYCAGYIILYVLVAISVVDVAYTLYCQFHPGVNDFANNFSLFSYIIFVMAIFYVRMYIRAKVEVDDKRLHIAFPAFIQVKEGQPRAMIIYRQGSTDLKFIDKTFELSKMVRYGYVEDLGYQPIDASGAKTNSKVFPVHEVAFITRENKRYHLNIAIYNARQQREMLRFIAEVSGVQPEGKLREAMK